MITIIKEVFAAALLFGIIKVIMLICKPFDKFISSVILNLGRATLYVVTAVFLLPGLFKGKKASGEFFINIPVSFITLCEKIYMRDKINYNICPKCFTKYREPRYVCPQCGNVYHSLKPSTNGILSINCSCGYKIPVTAWGKRKLKALCPTCGEENPLLNIPSSVIVLAGDSSLKDRFMDNAGLRKINLGQEAFYETIVKDEKGSEVQIRIVESAEADFKSSENLRRHKYYEYAGGFIFAIDAEVLGDINKEYMLSDLIDIMILNLQKNYGLKPGERIEKPLAIVLSTNINDPEEFLLSSGEELFINKIQDNFTNYKFFNTSSKENGNIKVINWIADNM